MKHFRDRQVYAQIEALLQRMIPVEFVEIGGAEAAVPAEAGEGESGEVEQTVE